MLVYFFRHLPKIILIGDYIIINLLFIIGEFYFFGDNNIGFTKDFKAQIVLLNLSWFVITTITKPYKTLTIKESSLNFNALTKSYILFVVSIFAYAYFVSSIEMVFKNLIYYFLAVGFSMTMWRMILFLYRRNYRVTQGSNYYSFNTVLVGENKLSTSLLSNEDLRWFLGIRGTYTSGDTKTINKYLGKVDQLFEDIETTKISNIIFCDDNIDIDLYKKIVEIAEHKMIRIYMVPDFKYANLGPYYFDVIHETPFLKLIKEPLSTPQKQILKRSFDIVFSSFVILFILSWLIPIVALIVKIESNSSVFFFQKRSGLKNEYFNCIKFRSMTENSFADTKTVTKNDSRITKFGAFMRKTSIDELPQFINVFLGQMSVVGPRPHMISQTEIYSKITKKYMTRHIVKPGITGWAQVMGARGEIFSHRDMEKRIEKDIWYIQNWSFFLDIKIIFLTLYNIVKGDEQAY